MRKATSLSLILFLMFAIVLPAFANPVNEVKTFGFTDERNREGSVVGGLTGGCMCHFGGPSYSQPLILNGDRWGGKLKGRMVAITVENNIMYGYLLPDASEPPPVEPLKLKPLWSVKLSGSVPTKSDPTFFEKGDKKYLFIGTYSKNLNVIDITDFVNVTQSKVKAKKSPHATDITSAPLVLKWRGHDVVICTSGDTGKVFIIVDPLKMESDGFYINAGLGRTSSSPAPVNSGKGFAIGLDQGRQQGQLQIYYLDDILRERPDGKVELKSHNARIVENIKSGLAASFSVDGNMLYFGDTQSNVYAYNTAEQKFIWWNNKYAGIFSNRSPSLTNNLVLFPAVGDPGEKGKLIAIDRNTGTTKWVKQFSSRAQTAATILTTPDGYSEIWEGTSDGWLAFLNLNGKIIDAVKISERYSLNKFGSGVCGGISAAQNYTLISTEEGIVGSWVINNFNLQAVSIDPGLPEGEKAKLGETYHGTAVFKYEGDYDWADVPIGVFYGDQYLKLTDADGNELPKVNVNGSIIYKLEHINKGEERTVHFTWTATSAREITAVINLDKPPVMRVFQENTFDDNEITVPVEVDAQNLRVQITSYTEQCIEGDSATVAARVTNDSNRLLTTRLVWKVNGEIVKDIPNFDLIGQYDNSVTIKPDQDCKVTVEVNPDRDRPASETTFDDNIDTCSITVLPAEKEVQGSVKIIAPDVWDALKPFNFKVVVEDYLPYDYKTKTWTDSEGKKHHKRVRISKTYNLNCTVTGKGVLTVEWNPMDPSGGFQKTIPREKSWTENFTEKSGSYTRTFTYTFPACGMAGYSETTVVLEASVTRAGTARKVVKIRPFPVERPELQLTK
ncbi:MAG: PQQ-binding-like beta-propeller repeat protein [Peptococcaceae bacterium]|nr:PQQ-binding-like beta-propeller repeat protein [Peptococcaceae bacterium]